MSSCGDVSGEFCYLIAWVMLRLALEWQAPGRAVHCPDTTSSQFSHLGAPRAASDCSVCGERKRPLIPFFTLYPSLSLF